MLLLMVYRDSFKKILDLISLSLAFQYTILEIRPVEIR